MIVRVWWGGVLAPPELCSWGCSLPRVEGAAAAAGTADRQSPSASRLSHAGTVWDSGTLPWLGGQGRTHGPGPCRGGACHCACPPAPGVLPHCEAAALCMCMRMYKHMHMHM